MQAFGSLEVACGLKAVEFWLRAAEAAYDSSTLPEALQLFQQASEIASVLSSMPHEVLEVHDSGSNAVRASSSTSLLHGGDQSAKVQDDLSSTRRPPLRCGTETFTALGLQGQQAELDWSIISRTTRVQMKRSMALCCLGIMLQHQ